MTFQTRFIGSKNYAICTTGSTCASVYKYIFPVVSVAKYSSIIYDQTSNDQKIVVIHAKWMVTYRHKAATTTSITIIMTVKKCCIFVLPSIICLIHATSIILILIPTTILAFPITIQQRHFHPTTSYSKSITLSPFRTKCDDNGMYHFVTVTTLQLQKKNKFDPFPTTRQFRYSTTQLRRLLQDPSSNNNNSSNNGDNINIGVISSMPNDNNNNNSDNNNNNIDVVVVETNENPLLVLSNDLDETSSPQVLSTTMITTTSKSTIESSSSSSSKREMLSFAIPALGIYLCNPLLSNMDNAFVGHTIGTVGLAALSPATICIDQMLYLFNFLGRATTGIVTRAYYSSNSNDNSSDIDRTTSMNGGNTVAARDAASARTFL